MATLKKDAIVFSNGRELPLPNGIVTINRSLELSDYYSRNILFQDQGAKTNPVVNVFQLTKEELIEIADLMIQLWMDLKDNVRQCDLASPDIFRPRKIYR